MSRNAWAWLIVLSLTLIVAPWIARYAGTGADPVEREARAIERSLRCPVCEGQSVADSNSSVALQMREEIRAMLAQGKTRDEILQHYVDRYGEWVLYMPPRRGVFLLGWLVPFLAVAAGGWMIRGWLRARVAAGDRSGQGGPAAGGALDSAGGDEPVTAAAGTVPGEPEARVTQPGPFRDTGEAVRGTKAPAAGHGSQGQEAGPAGAAADEGVDWQRELTQWM